MNNSSKIKHYFFPLFFFSSTFLFSSFPFLSSIMSIYLVSPTFIIKLNLHRWKHPSDSESYPRTLIIQKTPTGQILILSSPLPQLSPSSYCNTFHLHRSYHIMHVYIAC
ncbi:hypothetical protein Leryth_026584 [Lithospermum erythrorhizon]|nr:hypothetical protein Leryth_026584 [Lithospermum erythrorhizon]